MSRLRADTMPAVTVPPRLNGLPMAITHSPSRSLSESPNLTATSGFAGGVNFNTARSVFLSTPTSVALILVPSFMMTLISSASAMTWLLVTTMPEVSTIKPEPSELVLRGCMPPPLSPPGPPRRFLKKSSKNSSNGEPGGNGGMAPRPPSPPLASTVWVVEILTTASITFSATSAMPSGPRANAGKETDKESRVVAAPRQMAAAQGRRRWLNAGIAPVMSGLSPGNGAENLRLQCARTGRRRKHAPWQFYAISALDYGEKQTAATHDGVDPYGMLSAESVCPDRSAPHDPYQDQAHDRRPQSHGAEDVVRRRQRALHRPPHPRRARREQQAFEHKQNAQTD